MRTPPDKRGAQWWLAEHAQAEQAVTLAADMLERAHNESMRDLASRLLDERLDHLEHVEDTCDAILDALDPDARDMAERVYLRGETWGSVAKRHGMTYATAYARLGRALAKVPRD